MVEPGARVLVTGASSYVGMHCVAALLRAGHPVRASTRDLSRETALRAALPDQLGAREDLQFVALDILEDVGWDDAMSGCEFAVHLASPFPVDLPRDPDVLGKPAIAGTRRALESAARTNVSRVIVLSSLAAVHINHPRARTKPFDESDWSVLGAGLDSYSHSKTVAERAAWDCIEQLGDTAPELVVLNPGYVLGPALEGTYSTSLEWIRKPLAREIPGYIDVRITLTDVRDLAQMIVRALTLDALVGQRCCITAHNLGYREIVSTLAEIFGPRGIKVPTRKLPNFLVKAIALVDPAVRAVAPFLGLRVEVDTTRMRSLFDFELTPLRETLEATGESLIAQGRVG